MIDSQPRFVLDSFALLAFYQTEAGGPAVHQLLRRAERGEVRIAIATINLGETIYLTIRRRGEEQAWQLLTDFENYPVEVIDVDRSLALASAVLKAEHPISYADCIGAALTEQLDATFVTGD